MGDYERPAIEALGTVEELTQWGNHYSGVHGDHDWKDDKHGGWGGWGWW